MGISWVRLSTRSWCSDMPQGIEPRS
uniref:Uncharacterized protein n=1 Tax=Anguilla anguilla TaxID=7936 RepID=A0A0E9QWZ6_ANGAN